MRILTDHGSALNADPSAAGGWKHVTPLPCSRPGAFVCPTCWMSCDTEADAQACCERVVLADALHENIRKNKVGGSSGGKWNQKSLLNEREFSLVAEMESLGYLISEIRRKFNLPYESVRRVCDNARRRRMRHLGMTTPEEHRAWRATARLKNGLCRINHGNW
jgi:hypothetical protein